MLHAAASVLKAAEVKELAKLFALDVLRKDDNNNTLMHFAARLPRDKADLCVHRLLLSLTCFFVADCAAFPLNTLLEGQGRPAHLLSFVVFNFILLLLSISALYPRFTPSVLPVTLFLRPSSCPRVVV